MKRKLFPEVVCEQNFITMTPQTLVSVALRAMIEQPADVVLVSTNGTNQELIGIFTERDVMIRVAAAGRDPRKTRLKDVMTSEPDTLPPHATAADALVFMQNRHYRHLPVVQHDRVVGVVSLGDICIELAEQLKAARVFAEQASAITGLVSAT